ncbi:Flavoprotein-like protein YCP4 [Candida viswanathii]|uniref:Flavoprotein-like protein YCP4 n=1 Tax=Candida viswanathii TaxID=5486 RepID=A0A367XZS6_9ASCO|nr:Flavoprotein-like protein YCP4 [Candida viswanathii]
MKIAIIEYSTYGHITQLARAVQKGTAEAGYKADLFQVPETLSQDVLDKLHAAPKPTDIPVATLDTLTEYDAFIFGIPTRFGTAPAQFFEFFGATGGLWAKGALHGKPAGVFVSTGTQGGGQETTVRNTLNFLAHHGMPYIPFGYANAFELQANLDEIHGGSPYGAGTFAGADGSRQPSKLELTVAEKQGEAFAKSAAKLVGKKSSSSASKPAAAAAATSESKPAAAASSSAAPAEKKEAAAAPRAQQSTKAPESADKSSCSKCIIM